MKLAVSISDKKDEAHFQYAQLIYQKELYQNDLPYDGWSLSRALEESQAAYRENPHPVYLQQQAQILFAQKQYETAYNLYMELSKSALRSADIFYAAAQCKLEQEDKKTALAMLDSAVSTFTRPYPNNRDLRTATGNTWSKFFGVFDAGQYPVALVNRTPGASGWDLFNPISGINSYVDPIVNSEATIAIEVSATEAEGLISTTVNLEFLENVGDNLNLTLFIIEDNINATQLMPDGEKNESYIHNHLFREVITDVWGTQIDCTGAKGEKKMTTIDYQVDNSEWIIANCHIVAFVSNRDTRQIVNVAECDIN
jgi:tetratricopeptide (TPR) repeat protein